MHDLRVTLVQADLFWEDINKNLTCLKALLSDVNSSNSDLIVLPEMFNTAFSMNSSKLYEEPGGKSVQWMKALVIEKGCAITGSVITKENSHFYNRLIWMQADGTCQYYDKRHLFRMAGEDKYFSSGTKRITVKLKGWKICPLICYDLRFPVWSRNTDNYDCLIYIANWPEARRYPWSLLLKARAVENLCYVVGVNRIGKDGNEISFSGDSAIIDFKGNEIAMIKPFEEAVTTVKLQYNKLIQFRKNFPAHLDADQFEIL